MKMIMSLIGLVALVGCGSAGSSSDGNVSVERPGSIGMEQSVPCVEQLVDASGNISLTATATYPGKTFDDLKFLTVLVSNSGYTDVTTEVVSNGDNSMYPVSERFINVIGDTATVICAKTTQLQFGKPNTEVTDINNFKLVAKFEL